MTQLAARLTMSAMTASVPVAARDTYKGYETPRYTVIARDGRFETRQYAPSLMAEVTIEAPQPQALRHGFRILASYIFGENQAGEKIEMTSPVCQSGAGDMWTISFMMPRRHTIHSLPAADSAAIRFHVTEPHHRIVKTFSGRTTARRLSMQAAALCDHASARNIAIASSTQFCFYDDPVTLPWRRRNDVAFAMLDPDRLPESAL